jgi:hypothetical protein
MPTITRASPKFFLTGVPLPGLRTYTHTKTQKICWVCASVCVCVCMQVRVCGWVSILV